MPEKEIEGETGTHAQTDCWIDINSRIFAIDDNVAAGTLLSMFSEAGICRE